MNIFPLRLSPPTPMWEFFFALRVLFIYASTWPHHSEHGLSKRFQIFPLISSKSQNGQTNRIGYNKRRQIRFRSFDLLKRVQSIRVLLKKMPFGFPTYLSIFVVMWKNPMKMQFLIFTSIKTSSFVSMYWPNPLVNKKNWIFNRDIGWSITVPDTKQSFDHYRVSKTHQHLRVFGLFTEVCTAARIQVSNFLVR